MSAYKVLQTDWEVEYKSGCVWRHLGIHTCEGDLQAVRYFRRVGFDSSRLMRVRPAATLGVDPGPWRVFRFSK